VRADFEKAAAMGVRGFPTVVLKKGEEYILISNGYLEGERVAKMVVANL
jgi:protein-disulfide isomerase-like protein with CxxC motif